MARLGAARREDARRVDARLGNIERHLKTLEKALRVAEENAVRQIGRLDYERADIAIGVTSRVELLSRLRSVRKEPWTVEWIERSMRPTDVLWDIGANVGTYGLIAASVGGDAVRVVAVEPAPANYAALCDNVAMNGWSDRFVVLPIVLAESTGLAHLLVTDERAGAGVHALDGVATPKLPVLHRETVLGYAVDDLVELMGLPAPTLIKIDVDGAEAAILAGARRTLARPELRSVLVEIEESLSEDVVRALGEVGLELVDRVDRRERKAMTGFWYGIFERG